MIPSSLFTCCVLSSEVVVWEATARAMYENLLFVAMPDVEKVDGANQTSLQEMWLYVSFQVGQKDQSHKVTT